MQFVIFVTSFICGCALYMILLGSDKGEIDLTETTIEQRKGIVGWVKKTVSLHKKLLKIKYFNDRMNMFWIRLGRPAHFLPEDMMVTKLIVSFLALFLLFFVFGSRNIISLVFVTVLVFFLPDVLLNAQVKNRQNEIRLRIPEMIDILNLCVEAGLDFMAAVGKYIDSSEKNPIRDELQIVVQEVQLGSSRKEALRNMAYRIDMQEIDSFASVVIQSEELGTSLSVLHGYADEIRVKRWQHAEKLAAEAPTKMLIPMMIFVFPGVFLLIFGPMVLQLLTQPMFQ